MATHTDRRKEYRSPVSRPVFLENAHGDTRNVSASGVFFLTNGAYKVGDKISFSVDVYGSRVMAKCQGVIVRTEQHGELLGVAVKMTSDMPLA